MPVAKKSIPYSKNRHKPRYVYALVDPRDSQIRYVGCSFDLKTRLTNHLTSAFTRVPSRLESGRYQPWPVHEWLFHLIQNNERPLIVPIEECNIDNWKQRENYWIVKLFNAGADLTNVIIRGNIRLASLYPTED